MLSSKSVLVAALLGMALPAGSIANYASAEQVEVWPCPTGVTDLQVDAAITTGITYKLDGCNIGAFPVKITTKSGNADTLTNIAIVVSNPVITGSNDFTFMENLVLGHGSSITMNGGNVGGDVYILAPISHSSASITVKETVATGTIYARKTTAATYTPVVYTGGSLSITGATAERFVLRTVATDATITLTDCVPTSSDYSLVIGRQSLFTRSKLSIVGSKPIKGTTATSRLGFAVLADNSPNAAIPTFTDSQVTFVNNLFPAAPYPTNAKVANSAFTFTGNVFSRGILMDQMDFTDSQMTFRNNKLYSGYSSANVVRVTAKTGSTVDFDTSNFVDLTDSGSRNMVFSFTGNKNSVVALEGATHKLTNFFVTDTDSIGTKIGLREVVIGESVEMTFDGTTNTDVTIERIRVPRLAFESSVPSVNTNAKFNIVDNHEINVLDFTTALDKSTVTVFDNNFQAVDSNAIFSPADFSRSKLVFTKNDLLGLVSSITTADASEVIFRDNTFRQASKGVNTVEFTMAGGKFDHDISNLYQGGSIAIDLTNTNGNAFALDPTNNYGTVSFTQTNGVNGNLEFRSIVADSITADVAGSSYTTVTAESLTSDVLTVSGGSAAAFFMTISVRDNDKVRQIAFTNLHLRDSNVTVFHNTVSEGFTWSAVGPAPAEFTRTRALIGSNVFSSAAFDLAKTRGSELILKSNHFTEAHAKDALFVKMDGLGRFDVDKSNTFVGGTVEFQSTKSRNSVLEMEGQTLKTVTITQKGGEGEQITLRGNTLVDAALTIDGESLAVLIEGNTVSNLLSLTGDADQSSTKASITIQNNFGISRVSFEEFILFDSAVNILGNEFTSEDAASTFTGMALKNTPIVFESNRVLGIVFDSPAAKNSVVTFKDNAFLEATSSKAALSFTLADGGSIYHDETNIYNGGRVSVDISRSVDSLFTLEGIQSHGDVSFTETDSVSSRVTLRDFNTLVFAIAVRGSQNANVLVESVSSENFALNGGLGLTTTKSTFKILDTVTKSVSHTDLNLADSELTFAKNRFTSSGATTESGLWSASKLARTCITYTENSFQRGLNMAAAVVEEGSSLTFRSNAFWVSSATDIALSASVENMGRIDHDASNHYAGGIITIASNKGTDNIFVLEGTRTYGAVAYTEASLGPNAFVAVRGITVSDLTVNLGFSRGSSAVVESVIVSGDLSASMTKAVDSQIGIQGCTLRGTTTLAGSLAAGSNYYVRSSTATAPVIYTAVASCVESKACRVEFEQNRLSSRADGTPLVIAGTVGDFTTLTVAANRLGSSASGVGIAFNSATALTGSASLVVARNTASRFAALQKALYFANAYTFTGSADVWGNVFIAGAIRLKLGASPAKFNIANNRADFFLVTGAATSGRVSACNIFSGNDKEATIMGAGFKTVECDATTQVSVCGGSRVQPANDESFSACGAALVDAPMPTVTPTCGNPNAVATAAPTTAASTVAPIAAAPAATPAVGTGSISSSSTEESHVFLQSAGSASVWAAAATIAAVGAMMAL